MDACRDGWMCRKPKSELLSTTRSSVYEHIPDRPYLPIYHGRTIRSFPKVFREVDRNLRARIGTTRISEWWRKEEIFEAKLSQVFAAPLELLSNWTSDQPLPKELRKMVTDRRLDFRDLTVEVASSLSQLVERNRTFEQIQNLYLSSFKRHAELDASNDDSFSWISKLSRPCPHASVEEQTFLVEDRQELIEGLNSELVGIPVLNRILNTSGVEILTMEPDMSAFAILVNEYSKFIPRQVKNQFKEAVLGTKYTGSPSRELLNRLRCSEVARILDELKIDIPVGTKVLYYHSARGMSPDKLAQKVWRHKEKEKLVYRRGAWQHDAKRRCFVAWIWVLFSVSIAFYRGRLELKGSVDSTIEAMLKVVQVAGALLITVFGFVKLVVHDDAVLYRLMSGSAALTSHKSYAKFITRLSDDEEALAELCREFTLDRVTAKDGACFLRSPLADGKVVASPLPSTSLGRACYIKLGGVIVDTIRMELFVIDGGGGGEVAHFLSEENQRMPASAVAFVKALIIAAGNEHGQIDFVTRDYKSYAGTTKSSDTDHRLCRAHRLNGLTGNIIYGFRHLLQHRNNWDVGITFPDILLRKYTKQSGRRNG